jgi:KUP system potassium uptake protein
MLDITADNLPQTGATPHHGPNQALPALIVGAIGVVYGDIGTSPLYALQATLDPRYHLGINVIDLYGIVSLIFWAFVFCHHRQVRLHRHAVRQ